MYIKRELIRGNEIMSFIATPVMCSVDVDFFPSNRLIVGFTQGETVNSFFYLTHIFAQNNYSCLVKFLKENPEVKFYYWIDDDLKKLEAFAKFEFNENYLCNLS